MWQYLKWGFLATTGLIVFLFFQYTLPTHDVLRLVNTSVKRMDVGGGWFWASQDAGTINTETRDVRFIDAVWPDGSPMVYRNEDTNWRWPPYFKFDAADLNAEAQSLVSPASAPVWVSVRNYGWRMQWFTTFPNALSIKVVAGPDVTIIPYFNIIFLGVLGLGLLTLRRMFVNWRRRKIDPVVNSVGEAIGDGYEAVADKAGDVGDAASGLGSRIKRWFGRK